MPEPLTPEHLEAHLRAMLPHVEAVPLERLEADLSVGCVDGRRGTCAASAPGGNLGLFVTLLGALERHTGRTLTSDTVARLLEAYLDRFGAFYLHTDTHAWHRLARAAGLDPAQPSLLHRPPATLRPRLRALALAPEHVGCGHVRRLLEDPEAYGLRPGLTEDALGAVLDRLWSGDARITLEVLAGDHAERAVVHVHTASSPLPLATLCPHFGDLDLFVLHPDAVDHLAKMHVAFLTDQGLLPPPEAPAFDREQRRLLACQHRATLAALAADLPVFEVTLRFEQGVPTHLTVRPTAEIALPEPC